MEQGILIIRRISEEDYSTYYEMKYSRTIVRKFFAFESLRVIWKKEEENEEYLQIFTIIEKCSNEICGFCQLKHIDTPTPELGIDIIDGFMERGYAQEAIRLLMAYAKLHYNVDYFTWEAEKENLISRHIAKKLGGKLIEEKPLLPESFITFGKNKGIITSYEDVSYVCVYKI